MKTKVLVTGSTGFIGRHFLLNATDFDIIEADLLNKSINDINFTGIDTVLHLAAYVHQMKHGEDSQYFKVNRDLALQIALKAKENGVKQFILMSTVKVYGEYTNNQIAWNEESPCFPIDSYGLSKYQAEIAIQELEDENFKVAIIRSPLVYGEGVKANMLNLIKLIDKLPILPLGGIKNKRSLVYVGNLVALMKHIIQKQSAGIFIAGDLEPLSTSKLINLIAKELNKRIILIKLPYFIIIGMKYLKPNLFDRLFRSLILDNSNTNEILHFIPPYTTKRGINEMINWYKRKN
ncbi:MAG TPA: epimerase [Bacteroidales bacterium]|nr:epimerase [Bacteroidales bacterium]